MQGRFSPDHGWWWDGAQWQPALSADGLWRWDGRRWVPAAARAASTWPWVRRFASLAIAVLLFIYVGLFGLGAVLAHPVEPVRVDGALIRLLENCHVPADTDVDCAYLDSDKFCYRIHRLDFRPPLPSLQDRVGNRISFVVDRQAYESSRTIGDPYCNFEVAQIIIVNLGQEEVYSTAAMTEPQFVGHGRSAIIEWLLPGLYALIVLLGWNLFMEIRMWRKRRALELEDGRAQGM